MKNTIALLLLLISVTLFGNPIDENKAKLVGGHFFENRVTNASFKNGVSLELAMAVGNQAVASASSQTYFYIFNIADGDGFVIVSGDDNTIPVLGYSTEKDFDKNNIPPAMAKWMEGYKTEMRYILENKIPQSKEIEAEWNQLVEGTPVNTVAGAGVSPLVLTKWDQSPYYNALCPYDAAEADRTVTGCVATAMAQVMKYWNYPPKGTGSYSYTHNSYGTLSANFGATTYQWGSMPNSVTSSNSAVATLMYHCGISVEMNYDVAANGGSGAYVISTASPVTNCTEYALKTYFGYKNTLLGVERSNYTQTQWLALIKGELDNARPVLYAGYGSGGGHAFVCDGYDNNDYLHFNWGWGGYQDGYFSVNALNPLGVGTGGGTGGFNSGHQAIIGVEPPSSSPATLDMRLYSGITVNPNPIQYGAAFSVTVNVANYGSSSAQNFSGDYAAAVFNANDEFVAYVETKTGQSLDFNSYYINPLVFSNSGLSSLTPGTYKIGIYYRPDATAPWTAFANGNYQNFITVEVEGNNTNPLKLYAAITTNPTVIVRNQTFTVTFDIANYGGSTFNGEVSVDLHKSDGTWIRELDNKTGLSLASGYHFTNGLTYTITGGLPDSAGTYQLFVWDKPNTGNWEFLGNGTFSNPITIQVVEPGLPADAYEVNNVVGQAYNLPVSFNGNIAKTSTTGSNCHKGNDYDYYKVVLPAGYTYTVSGRIHDSYSSGNGNTYTLDGLISYSTDGSSWSDAFDDVISGTITVNNGGTVYFLVSPFFTGETGTYLMDVTVNRSTLASSAKEITGFSVTGIVGNANINSAAATVDLTVSSTTDITVLTPTITVSNFATINPPSGAVRNFTNPVVYTVTAQDGSAKDWTVTVTKQSGVGINGLQLDNVISVYPNPATGVLNINLEQYAGTATTVSLLTMQGVTVINKAVAGKLLTLDIAGIKPGIYLVQVETADGILNKKIQVQ